jgi:hypothetical protein
MALADLARTKADSAAPWRTCAVCHALATIPPAEADALREMLSDRERRYSKISEEIAEDPDTPLDLDTGTLSRHARGRCGAKERLR